jgi:RecA-family ATPase
MTDAQATLVAFRERCQAAALRVRNGEEDRIEAVDYLQTIATGHGLVDEFGPDRVQRVISEAFTNGAAPSADEQEIIDKWDRAEHERANKADNIPIVEPPPEQPPPQPLRFVDMSTWDHTELPRRQWWLDDCIPLRQPTLLSGEGAIGKSILLLQLLVSTSLGVPWFGTFRPSVGPTIYLGAEDEEDEIRRRLTAILAFHDRKFTDLIESGFRSLAYAGKDVVLAEFDRSGRIKPTLLFQQIYDAARELKPKGIAIDPVSDVFLGDEIKRDQVRQFNGLMRKLAIDCNCGVIIASHPSLTGIKSGTGLSGSTQWHNSVRARAYFRRPKSDDDEESSNGADDGRRELQFMKNQYGPLSHIIALQWRDGLWLPVTTSAATECNVEDLFLQLLRRFTTESRKVSANKGPTYAPAKFAEQPEAKTKKISSRAFAEAMERLLAMKKIAVVNEGSPSRLRSYLVVADGTSEKAYGQPFASEKVGPAPAGTCCVQCNGERSGPIYMLRDFRRPGSKPDVLHEGCAREWFGA